MNRNSLACLRNAGSYSGISYCTVKDNVWRAESLRKSVSEPLVLSLSCQCWYLVMTDPQFPRKTIL